MNFMDGDVFKWWAGIVYCVNTIDISVVPMVFGINLSKNDKLKLFALAVALFFIFEIYSINSQYRAGTTGADGSAIDIDNFDGLGSANATILSWDPGLLVSGEDSAKLEIEALKKDGLISYSSEGSEGTIVTLSGRTAFPEVVRRLLGANATLTGYASVSLSNIRVQGNDVGRNVSSETFRFRLPPVFEPGDTVGATFQARVENGKLVAVGDLQFAPQQPLTAIVAPVSLRVKDEFYQAQVQWNERNAYSQGTISDLIGTGYNATYRKRAAITFDPALTQAQVATLAGSLPQYAISLQAGALVVASGFNDTQRASEDLGTLGLNPVFLPSIIEIVPNAPGNESYAYVLEKLAGVLGNDTKLQRAYTIEATLPGTIEAEGRNYTMPQATLDIGSASLPTDGSMVALLFTPMGRMVVGIDRAQIVSLQALMDEQNPESIALPDANASTIEEMNASAIAEGNASAIEAASGAENGNSTLPFSSASGGSP